MTSDTATRRLPEIVTALYDILEPLDAGTRQKALRSVLAMLDTSEGVPLHLGGSDPEPSESSTTKERASKFTSGKRALMWMRKAGISDDMLENAFHVENGKPELFASPPGDTKREQTTNVYLLQGVATFLASDEPRVNDSDAVSLCKKFGCYDQANHAQTRSTFGNKMTGSKETGFVVTAPGLERVATLIKGFSE